MRPCARGGFLLLRSASLQYNAFTGGISSRIGTLTLLDLDLSHNGLNGTIPDAIWSLSALLVRRCSVGQVTQLLLFAWWSEVEEF